MSVPNTFTSAVNASDPRPPQAAVQCHVTSQRLGLVYAGILLPSLGLLAVIMAIIMFTDGDAEIGAALLVLGFGLLYSIWPLLRRAQLPYLATLGPGGLRLDPRDRTTQLGKPAQSVPLSDIVGFSEQAVSRTDEDALQLVLFLADGRKLRLADRPVQFRTAGPGEPEPVTVAELGQALRPLLAGRGLAPEALRRPNFYQSGVGKVLAWLCWGCVAAGAVLLFVPGVDVSVGFRLLAFSIIYLGLYSRNRKLGA